MTVMAAAAAQAQTPARDPMFCVHDTLTDRKTGALVAESFLSDTVPEDDLASARLHLADAVKTCTEQLKLTEGQAAAMADLGLYGVLIDFLVGKLKAGGASEDAIGHVRTIIGRFSDAEIDRFFEADWRSDLAFMGKVKGLLVGGGVPDSEPVISTAFRIIEIEAQAKQAAYLFKLGVREGS